MSVVKVDALAFSKCRADFPFLKTMNRGRPLVYLDSASSAQKPLQVVEAMSNFYFHDYANIHRGIYELSERSSQYFDEARLQAQQFINAKSVDEIVFVKSTTEAINLIARTFGPLQCKADDEIILSTMEHHSNIVPWQLLQTQLGIKLKIIPINDEGELDLDAYRGLFTNKTKLVSVVHASNVLGTINPVKEMACIAHAHGVPILLDGAQAAPHIPVDVSDIDCDFYAFSAHKLYGPTGIALLYAKKPWIEQLPPYQGGGSMIETVSFSHVTFAKGPQKFEAGTPHIAGAVGFAAAMHYLENIGLPAVRTHEQTLLQYALPRLQAIDGLRLIGTSPHKVGVISFVLEDVHAHDVGTVLDHEGIAVRAGHHCAMPLMERFNVPATVRASFGIYNDESDVDALVNALQLAKRMFA